MRTRTLLLLLSVVLSLSLWAQQPRSKPDWHAWQFLLGEWEGEGGGGPGQGAGWFSFTPDLQQTVLVRRNHAQYPATKERPAYAHDDLMVVYLDAEGKTRAWYTDNEGHVIQYAVTVAPQERRAVFLSDAAPGAPRYRLTYTADDTGRLAIRFEMAPPNRPEAFSTYIQASARRKGDSK